MLDEKFRKEFDDLVPKASELHSSTWCISRQRGIATITLMSEECCNCRFFICNGGDCDPL